MVVVRRPQYDNVLDEFVNRLCDEDKQRVIPVRVRVLPSSILTLIGMGRTRSELHKDTLVIVGQRRRITGQYDASKCRAIHVREETRRVFEITELILVLKR